MKHTALAILSAFALAAPLTAQAADMPLKAPPPPAPVVNWTGCYVDGGAGYGVMDNKHTTNTTFGGVPGTTIYQTDGADGWLGRVGVGCDYQVAPKWVIGALAQYDWMGIKGTNSPLEVFGLGAGGTAPFVPVSATTKESGAWYAGGRIGYLLTPSILTYADFGYTQTRMTAESLTTNLGAPVGFGYPATTYQGWFLGGGTETAISDWLPGLPSGLFLRTAYRFSAYRKAVGEISTTTGLLDGNVENNRIYNQTVTTELVWRFNWMGH
jgi:outer membrane immunogenic protein